MNPEEIQNNSKKYIIPKLKPSQYIGNYDDKGNKVGFGILKWPNGVIFKGFFVKDHIKGWGIVIYNNKDIFKGKFSNDKAKGFGIYKYNNGKIQIGYWNNDYLNEIGYELNDNIYYEGEFENGEKNGIGTFKLKENNKIIYEGEVKNNNYEGYGIKYSEKGTYYGIFKNNIMEGLGERVYLAGLKHIGYFKNEKLKGFGINYILHKIYIIGIWKDDDNLDDGIFKKCNENSVKYGVIQNGIKSWCDMDQESAKFKENNSKKYSLVINFNIEPVRHLFEDEEDEERFKDYESDEGNEESD